MFRGAQKIKNHNETMIIVDIRHEMKMFNR
jgi:hypothetical protein